MGMYDNINYECTCPVCHGKVHNFQSKSGDCVLDTLAPNQVENFYSLCGKCGCRLEFNIKTRASYVLTVSGKRGTLPDTYTKIVFIP